MEEAGQEAPRTAQDLAIEQLRAEIAEMKAAHAAQVKELQDANKGLWAQAHRPVEPEPAPVPEAPKAFDPEKALKAFNETWGIKDKE